MKKTLLAVLGVLCSATMMAGFASCFGSGDGGNSSSTGGGNTPTVTYRLDSTKFDKELTYKEAFPYSGLTLKGSDGSTVAVTDAMVSGDSTTEVGNKTLTVSYGGKTIASVSYTVKYEVEFIVDGAVYGAPQYVMSASEIVYPAAPEKADYEFTGWSVAKGTAITDNTQIVAQFEGVEETADIKIDFGTKVKDGVYEMEYNDIGDISVSVTSTGTNVTWSAVPDNDNIAIEEGQDVIALTSLKAGVTTLTVTAENAEGAPVSKSCKIVVKPQDFMINELELGSYGFEGVRTLGRLDASGNVSQTALTLAAGKEGSVGKGFNENIKWASNNSKVTVNNGVVTLAEGSGAEMVKFTATFEVNGKVYATSAAYEVRCVFDGVNVSSFDDLYKTSRATNPKPIVLQKDIKDDFSNFAKGSGYEVIEMNTTYDDTYYKNKGEQAKIKVLLQFKNDLYGNGYQINAHNAAYGLDESDTLKSDALFKGPLNFVAMGNSDNAGLLSVKAQDNVCFALFEGVTVNNVELRGCDLKESEGTVDLTDLTYTGTTVEVFGDDVTIEYSRITNGRTVLRIFGAAEDATQKIHVNIKNSVLRGARDFILRIGSNRFFKSETEAAPYLPGDDATKRYVDAKNLSSSKSYKNMTTEQKASYDENYINTFVNVENSVFQDAGIFAVGMDSHFAGVALHDPENNSVVSSVLGESAKYWKGVAKTSYGAKLTLKGDVKMYTWKPVDDIDSSTLIENLGRDMDWTWKDLTFDVKTMISEISTKPGFETLLADYKSEKYVHGAVAFFGGGKNYSVLEQENNADGMVGFSVSFEQVGQTMLETAAGDEDFYFILCRKTSSFTPEKQAEMLDSEGVYDYIYAK